MKDVSGKKLLGKFFAGREKTMGGGGGEERVKIIVRRRKFCVRRINKKKN